MKKKKELTPSEFLAEVIKSEGSCASGSLVEYPCEKCPLWNLKVVDCNTKGDPKVIVAKAEEILKCNHLESLK
jgi:hypothetical protein